MFSAKFFALFVALLGFINVAVAATPPACLLDVIGAQPDPSDVETICNKKSVPSDISSKCDDQKSAAMSAFASVCKDAGVTVGKCLVQLHCAISTLEVRSDTPTFKLPLLLLLPPSPLLRPRPPLRPALPPPVVALSARLVPLLARAATRPLLAPPPVPLLPPLPRATTVSASSQPASSASAPSPLLSVPSSCCKIWFWTISTASFLGLLDYGAGSTLTHSQCVRIPSLSVVTEAQRLRLSKHLLFGSTHSSVNIPKGWGFLYRISRF